MKAGVIEAVHWQHTGGQLQELDRGAYIWESFDPVVAVAARHGLQVLPFVYSTPRWVARKYTTLPIDNVRARNAWTAFLQAAVKRYGPGGEFWAQHAPGVVKYEPAIPTPLPIRSWQIWNEANFFYFAYPASPQRYAKLLQISSPAIKGVDPGAKVILTGLFGNPTAQGARGMPAAKFLEILYRTPGIKSSFDGIALHPYAVDSETLEELVEALHEVTVENHDRVPLYITEMGWGSQNDFNQVAFEQGIQGQVKELRAALGAPPGGVEGSGPGVGRCGTKGGGRGVVEGGGGEGEDVPTRVDPLDIDADFPFPRHRHEGQIAGMAEVETQRRGGSGEHRLAVAAEPERGPRPAFLPAVVQYTAPGPARPHPDTPRARAAAGSWRARGLPRPRGPLVAGCAGGREGGAARALFPWGGGLAGARRLWARGAAGGRGGGGGRLPPALAEPVGRRGGGPAAA